MPTVLNDGEATMPTTGATQLLPEHRDRVKQAFQDLENRAGFERWQHLDDYYELFRTQLGPQALAGLDGVALLERMHKREGQNCLMYWLEFKNDDDFPGLFFGSIGGGSATKFGIYQKAATGKWMGGASVHGGEEISQSDAVEYARTQRDQLVDGCARLEALGTDASDDDYLELQHYFDEHLSVVSNWSWAHKYFHLLFPDKLDDFHNANFQRFYLAKLLQHPPEDDGRLVCGGRYVRLARSFGRPMALLSRALQEAFGAPHEYWRIDASKLPVARAADEMRSAQVAALSWAETGDISDLPYTKAGKATLLERVDANVDLHGAKPKNVTQDVFSLALKVAEGDLVIVTEGSTGKAIGQVTGPYEYAAESPLAHRRPVEWLDLGEHPFPDEKGWPRALSQYDLANNKIVVEERLLHPKLDRTKPSSVRLRGREGHVQSILDRKGQVILYGPPGTGKTYWAQRAADALLAQHFFAKGSADLSDDEREVVKRHIRLCTFHPAYGYEDFLEGYRPEERDGRLAFRLRDGIFKALCEEAAAHADERFVLIIDEINRGDVPRIFGELLTVLEKDKRGREVLLPLSGARFTVPPNVAVIGTMNTADRSIALLDTALRRRFGFIELMPDAGILEAVAVDGIPLGPWLEALNAKIVAAMGPDGRNLQVGHAYLLESGHPVTTLPALARVVRDDIVPLLQEYCYEDYRMLEQILGKAIVDAALQQVHVELFQEDNREALKLALLAIAPDITASPQAVAAEAEVPAEVGPEDVVDGDHVSAQSEAESAT